MPVFRELTDRVWTVVIIGYPLFITGRRRIFWSGRRPEVSGRRRRNNGEEKSLKRGFGGGITSPQS